MTTSDRATAFPEEPQDDSEPPTVQAVPEPDPFAGHSRALSLSRPTFANAWIWSAWLAGVALASMAPSIWVLALLLPSALTAFLVYSRSRPASTVRRIIVRLPVIREPEVLRIGSLVGIADATCARCESFDHEAGQRMLDKNPMFRQAAGHLSPSQMQKSNKPAWSEANGFDARGQPKDDGDLQWSQLGVCKKQGKGVFSPQSCPRWS